ncbi:MAG TPA: SUMF1/EgtB/PvdO family nonheme iron enzyme, partial [Rectinemataceae bacterium]|nr:SUMF1/EgtB/PvdO family nonheme iron enzyme [Rectinemataceae bacterium]
GLEALERGVGSNRALLPWLESLLPRASRERLAALAALAPASGGALPDAPTPVPGPVQTIAGLRFRALRGGSFQVSGESPEGRAVPYLVTLPPYSLAETEVTRRQWASFLAAVPAWRPENRERLVAEGLADESYLADWGTERPDEPVTGVSWEAARAYCAWLSLSAPAGREVRLPSEAMWEHAAGVGGDAKKPDGVFSRPDRRGPEAAASRDALGLYDLFGNVWEWCSDAYVPYPALLPEGSPWIGSERSVRGGGWADRAETVDLGSRGSFPPSFSSPFLGFRPAMVDLRTGRR